MFFSFINFISDYFIKMSPTQKLSPNFRPWNLTDFSIVFKSVSGCFIILSTSIDVLRLRKPLSQNQPYLRSCSLSWCVCGEIVQAYVFKLSFDAAIDGICSSGERCGVCVIGFSMHEEEQPGSVNRTNIDVQQSCLPYSKLCGTDSSAKRNRERQRREYIITFCVCLCGCGISVHLETIRMVFDFSLVGGFA